MDELQLDYHPEKTVEDNCVTVITETRLNPRVPDSGGDVGSHLIHRTNSDIIDKYCSPGLELLAVKCRSSRLPQEFSDVVVRSTCC